METEESYKAGYVKADSNWIRDTIDLLSREERGIAGQEYRAVFRAAWDSWKKMVPEHRVENKARHSANCWLRGYVYGE